MKHKTENMNCKCCGETVGPLYDVEFTAGENEDDAGAVYCTTMCSFCKDSYTNPEDSNWKITEAYD